MLEFEYDFEGWGLLFVVYCGNFYIYSIFDWMLFDFLCIIVCMNFVDWLRFLCLLIFDSSFDVFVVESVIGFIVEMK